MDLTRSNAPQALTLRGLRKDYAPAVQDFNRWLTEAKRLAGFDSVSDYLTALKGEVAARTVRKHKSAIKAAVLRTFAEAARDMQWRRDLDATFAAIKTPKPRPGLDAHDILSRSELEAMLDGLDDRKALFIRALYATGARISELLNVRLSDCKREGETFLCRVTGKGNRERVLPISRDLFLAIRETFAGHQWLIEKEHSGRYSRQYWHRVISQAGARIGKRAFPHRLRHSRVTHLLEAGQPLDAVSRFVGHSKVATTAEVYAHARIPSQALTESEI